MSENHFDFVVTKYICKFLMRKPNLKGTPSWYTYSTFVPVGVVGQLLNIHVCTQLFSNMQVHVCICMIVILQDLHIRKWRT